MLTGELLLASYLIQAVPVDVLTGPALVLRELQHWLSRFAIAYAVSLGMLIYLRRPATGAVSANTGAQWGPWPWWVVHAALLVPFLYLSTRLYANAAAGSFVAIAAAWHACALAGVFALGAALAAPPVWREALRRAGALPLYAIVPAAAAVAAIHASQMLWAPSAEVTFKLVRLMLHPLYPALQADPATLTLATQHFAVNIAEACSGLEGMGLMLAFCTAWLWIFRREFFFPQALAVIPLGILFVFLLNAVRIAALVLIADAGYERIAVVGFHSQAGWIAFNIAAFAVAILARRAPWVSRVAREGHVQQEAADNPTAAYLMPLLGILAAGMIAHAMSSGFELLYPLRLVAALAALWVYRRSYRDLNLRGGWRGVLVGTVVFCLWIAFARLRSVQESMPTDLAVLAPPLRALWIACRAFAAIVTVPLAEELAYRGFLMRRFVAPAFQSVDFRRVGWPALALSSLAFGIMHGNFWFVGILAGAAYGLLAIRTGKLGEAILAHGTSNALLAAYVLLFDQWQLW